MVLEIRKYPDPVLRQKTETIQGIDAPLRKLIDDMVETMYAAKGVGLAAPQVGVSKKLVVIDVGAVEEGASLLVLMNPEVVESEGSESDEEGCLSLPDYRTDVKRASRVVVKALDREGREITVEAEGLLARALQHEIDHLEGKLILDKASFLSREFYIKRIKKQHAKTG